MRNITQIPAPRVELLDPRTGLMSREWFIFFNNIYTIVGANQGIIQIENGGTGLDTLPTNGQLLIGDTTTGAYVLNTLAASLGVSVTNGAGTITIANTGVVSNVGGIGISVSSATGDVTITNTGVLSTIAGTGISVSSATGNVTIANTGVLSVSGASPVVSSSGATPAISLASGYGDTQNPYTSKTANYVLASPNGAAGVPTFRALVATDIPTLTSGSSILYGNGAGGFSNVTIGTGVSFAGGTLSATGSGGTVTSVTGTAPVVSSGGTTPAISMAAATTSVNGYLTSTDWTTFNNKQPAGAYLTSATGVTTFSGNSTGLTPATATSGAITLAGTLVASNGGTGLAGTLTGISYMNGTSAHTVATTAQVLTLIGTVPVANGGTGVTSSTGSGNNVLNTSPTLVTPLLGTPTSGVLTNCTGYQAINLSDYASGAYTPTVTSSAGAITSYTAVGQYTKIGKMVTVSVTVVITNAGTAVNSQAIISMPYTAGGTGISYAITGRENAVTGSSINGYVVSGGATFIAYLYNNTATVITNYSLIMSLTYTST